MGCIPENVAIKPMNDGIMRANQTRGVFGHSVKYRLKIIGRTGNRAQDLARGIFSQLAFSEFTLERFDLVY
jgi:hypothetical protein